MLSLAARLPGPIVLARYRWTGEWHPAKIRGAQDATGTFTIAWLHGSQTLQVGTELHDISDSIPAVEQAQMQRELEQRTGVSAADVPPHPSSLLAGTSVWQAAKRGGDEGAATVLAAVDAGRVGVNAVGPEGR